MALTMVLAGCGQGHPGAASSAPTGGASPASGAPHASAGPAALPAQTPASGASSAEAAKQAAAAARAKLSSMSVPDLLAAARGAYAKHQLVSPAGDNAMEYYEAVLAKDPNNQVAKDALRETFPFGVPDVEAAITQNNFDEAGREIDVLAKADPTNYTLTLLRSKLDAQRKLQARQQAQQQQQALRASALAAQQTAAKATAAKEAAAERLASQQAAARAAAAPPPPKAATPVASAPPPPVGESRGVQVVQWASPTFPVEAARTGRSGFAVVEFTVTADGRVTGAHVISSNPRRVFDRSAIEAIERSQFRPALRDGQSVSSVVTRRIDFQLGG
ncbi:MAG TPA: TonB family protein [Rhodanobacteraceae bacterium]|nr:TonB family protein [Rhodanobacteraceae bacterium]